MLNLCNPLHLHDELQLKYWQFILRVTRFAAQAKRWGAIFAQNRAIMALAFLAGILIGLIPAIR